MYWKKMYTPSALLAVSFMFLGVAIGLWDLYVTASGHGEDTVTSIVGRWAAAFPILPLVIGILIGHLFWPRSPTILP